MINREQYIQYLISTSENYTCAHLATHLENVSHDAVTDYLHRDRLTATQLWETVKAHLNDQPQAYLIVDDSVQNKLCLRRVGDNATISWGR
jgi:hypothetical protein